MRILCNHLRFLWVIIRRFCPIIWGFFWPFAVIRWSYEEFRIPLWSYEDSLKLSGVSFGSVQSYEFTEAGHLRILCGHLRSIWVIMWGFFAVSWGFYGYSYEDSVQSWLWGFCGWSFEDPLQSYNMRFLWFVFWGWFAVIWDFIGCLNC